MIAQITGRVAEVRVAQIVIEVGGLGYLIAVTHGSGFVHGDTVTLYTYLAVRENALDLYGFSTQKELAMFEELIKIPKIGPKTALQILSQADSTILTKAVHDDDPVYLSKMSGIGKKSAEKIVTGLKDVLGDSLLFPHDTKAGGFDTDVVDALMSLGYSQRDAVEAVQKIPKEISDTNARIKHALKYVGG